MERVLQDIGMRKKYVNTSFSYPEDTGELLVTGSHKTVTRGDFKLAC